MLGTEEPKITSPRSLSKREELGLNSDLQIPNRDSKLCEPLLSPSCSQGVGTPEDSNSSPLPYPATATLGELSYLVM